VATATTHHYATVNPDTGEVVLEFDSLDAAAVDRAVETAHRAFGAWRDRPSVHGVSLTGSEGAGAPIAGIEEFANRKLICAVAPDAPVGGFVG